MKKIKLNKAEWSWVLYDMAYSAYSILATVFLPIYLKVLGKIEGLSNSISTSHWGYLQSISTLAIALIAPTIGALSDYRGMKKSMFSSFFFISIASLFIMVFSENYYILLFLNLLCAIGFSGSNMIYGSYLIDVTESKRMNYISSLGFGIGYAGRCLPYVISIILYYYRPFNISTILAVKISIILTIVWWIIFTFPFLLNVKQIYGKNNMPRMVVISSFKSNLITLKKIIKDKNMMLFMSAYFFYNNGVSTIISMSTDFGYDLGISVISLSLALLVTQIIAAPSVMVFEKIARKYSTKFVILISICVFTGICSYAFFIKYSWQFWVMSITVGLVLGTLQALSKSYFGRMIPNKNQNGEYFGFFSIFSRYSSILGPLIIAIFTKLTGNSRYGLLSLVILFVIGFIILLHVKNIDKSTVNLQYSYIKADNIVDKS
ncbi:MFS transporter [Clostridium pasteurianum]|uniref:MFS transporter n=1 Tax=Clostridium pasteurianum TaxID=1501 RepID=UPI002260D2BE|nr:MFS transporter [Clostridium pasteurianum]UZW14827.1 MFS transporter [Clostridium pasteurianum]